MRVYLCELIGTMVLIVLGDGVVANVTLKKSGMNGGGSVQIALGWGLAVMLPAFIFGDTTGAHFNPAVTLAMFWDRTLDPALILGYIISQFIGAFLGSLLVWLMFYDQFKATEDAKIRKGCFCTSPSVRNIPRNILCEAVATFILLFAIKGFDQVVNMATGLSNFFIFAIITSIGMSLGGVTGYAMNPARDLGPRFAYWLLYHKKGESADWGYAFVPVIGPVIGALLGVTVHHFLLH